MSYECRDDCPQYNLKHIWVYDYEVPVSRYSVDCNCHSEGKCSYPDLQAYHAKREEEGK